MLAVCRSYYLSSQTGHLNQWVVGSAYISNNCHVGSQIADDLSTRRFDALVFRDLLVANATFGGHCARNIVRFSAVCLLKGRGCGFVATNAEAVKDSVNSRCEVKF